MPTRPHYASFADMPKGLRSFVFSDEYEQADKELQTIYGIDPAKFQDVGDRIMDTVFGELTLPAMFQALKEVLVPASVPEEKWKDFTKDVIRLEFWPLRELFGAELMSIVEGEGMSTAGWTTTRVLLKPLTYAGASAEIAARAGFSLMGPQLRERMRDLVVGRMKKTLTDAQVRETLLRQSDFGGLGLDAATAEKTLATMNDVLGSVEVLSEADYADWLASQAHGKAPSQEDLDDEKEISEIQKRVPEAPKVLSVLEQAIEKVWENLKDKPQDDYLAKRLRNIISSRLRDIRNASELQQLLRRDTKVGGLGLAQDKADPLAAQIEASYQELHAAVAEEEKKRLAEQMELQKKKVDERRRAEADEHARWFQEKVAVRKNEEAQQKTLADQMRQSFGAAAVHPVDANAKKVETQRFGDLVPVTAVAGGVATASRSSGPAPMQTESAPRSSAAAPAFPPTNIAPVPSAVPVPTGTFVAHPEVKVSRATAEIQQQVANAGRPRIEEIRAAPSGAPRLSGLVQELKSMSVPEFRRLGKTPESAAEKIMQKLEILGQESFEKRLEGVKAWQECPLQGAYLGLLSEAFRAGKPVADLAEERRQAGQDVLNAAEISAVISLNSKLHY